MRGMFPGKNCASYVAQELKGITVEQWLIESRGGGECVVCKNSFSMRRMADAWEQSGSY